LDEQSGTLPAGWVDFPITIGRLVRKRDDGTEWPIDFDKALWVEQGAERGYLVGNGHTHRGRFRVCFPDRSIYVTTTMSVYELTAISAEAYYWLKGYLTGCEPSIDEYLGRKVIDEDYVDPTDEEWIRYGTFITRYLKDGDHIRLNRRPNRALVITEEERAKIRIDNWRPWTYVGERVLVFDGAEWVEADPQPKMDGPWLAGSICAERERDNLVVLESDWWVCCDCGEVTDDL
jgi:hypothetical protein